ncbi:hypothetical protein QQ020_03425 [Fulvivirgaceae bacterium BMA12]|uniref:Uncharacterized protein n=1 Tax=Agaribacillus aureus TaxID=3051825 RepID=A0ABT8L061_9BACT|nr:hypothetical protein [Fulvivirgaceae bacterium BMA12]
MKNQLKVGNVVGIFRTGMVGEVTKVIQNETQVKCHVKIPGEDETYLYSKDDLHLFCEAAEKNIRKEWQEEASPEKQSSQSFEKPVYYFTPIKIINSRYINFLDKIRFLAKILVFIGLFGCWITAI